MRRGLHEDYAISAAGFLAFDKHPLTIRRGLHQDCTISAAGFLAFVSLLPAIVTAKTAHPRMPGVNATISISSGTAQIPKGDDISLSCIVVFPGMFELYEPYFMRWYRRSRDADDWIKLSSNELLKNGDKKRYSVCYHRPGRFQSALNYTLHIKDFSDEDAGQYRCQGIDNFDVPSWVLNADVTTERLTLPADTDSSLSSNAAFLSNAGVSKKNRRRSCSSGGFVYQTKSVACTYYSQHDTSTGIRVIEPCPPGTAFDLSVCSCNKDARCPPA